MTSINDKADGNIGVQMGLMAAQDELQLSDEQMQPFYEATPSGEALWIEFKRHRDAPNAKDDYGFVDFVREILGMK